MAEIMRFSTNQLRMLQESLAPPVPELEAPPELQKLACAAPAPACAPAAFPVLHRPHPPCAAEAGACCCVPLTAVLGLYSLAGALCMVSAASSHEISRHILCLSLELASAALVLQSLACPHSRLAQWLGRAAAISITPAFAIASAGQPAPAACAAWACSLFFSLSAKKCGLRLRMLAGLAGLLCCGCATAGSFFGGRGLWAVSAVSFFVQALATSGSLAQFDLICAVKSG